MKVATYLAFADFKHGGCRCYTIYDIKVYLQLGSYNDHKHGCCLCMQFCVFFYHFIPALKCLERMLFSLWKFLSYYYIRIKKYNMCNSVSIFFITLHAVTLDNLLM